MRGENKKPDIQRSKVGGLKFQLP